MIVYTDGSYHPPSGLGCWCVLIQHNTSEIFFENYSSNTSQHEMELTAVIEAMQYAYNTDSKTTIHIVTDSQYVADLPKRRIKLEQSNYTTKAGKPIAHNKLIQTFFYWTDTIPYTIKKVKAHSKINHENKQHLVDQQCRKKLRIYIKENGINT